MVVALALIALWWSVSVAPRLLAEAVATIIAVAILWRVRRSRRAIASLRRRQCGAVRDPSAQPSRAERRLLARGLRLAVRQAEFTSLLPEVAAYAARIADGGGF